MMKKTVVWLWLIAVLVCMLCVPASALTKKQSVTVLDGAVLVTFGASNTALSSWPQDVADALNMNLINSGIGGNNTAHGRVRFERDVLAYDPDFVTICFGTNDFNRQGSGQPQVTPEEYRDNLTYFITELQKIDAVPILITSPIISESACGGATLYPEGSVNAALDVYVGIVRELAAEYGVPLIDMHKIGDEQYTAQEFLIGDGVHLTKAANAAFTEALCAYFTANYEQDPDAPRVEKPQAPETAEVPFTSSIIPFDPEEWLIIYPDTVVIAEESDGALSFSNTTGLWPEAHYSPRLDETLAVPVRGSYLTVDIELEAAMNMMLFFNGATPTLGYDGDLIALNPLLKAENPSLRMSGDDILGGQHIQCTLYLEDIIPDGMIAEDGTVLFSGVKLYIVGEAGKKVTVNKLEVTAVDPSELPPEPVYEYGETLMPDSAEKITAAQGVAGVEYHEDGAFTLTRDEKSSIAWPSVRVEVGKEIDLAKTPLLFLRVNMDGGAANGHLYYTTSSGVSGSVQLSQLVNGTVNDFSSDIKVYADLAAHLGTDEVITVQYLTLSVYGGIGDSILWKEIIPARLVKTAEEISGETSEETSLDRTETSSAGEPAVSDTAVGTSDGAQSSDAEKETNGVFGWLVFGGIACVIVVVLAVSVVRKRK